MIERFQVTENDISGGVPGEFSSCPVALAAYAHFGAVHKVRVGIFYDPLEEAIVEVFKTPIPDLAYYPLIGVTDLNGVERYYDARIVKEGDKLTRQYELGEWLNSFDDGAMGLEPIEVELEPYQGRVR